MSKFTPSEGTKPVFGREIRPVAGVEKTASWERKDVHGDAVSELVNR